MDMARFRFNPQLSILNLSFPDELPSGSGDKEQAEHIAKNAK